MPVAPRNYIVEVYAHLGAKIDRLEFVTLDSMTGATTKWIVGGSFGTKYIDATPPGNCQMVNIALLEQLTILLPLLNLLGSANNYPIFLFFAHSTLLSSPSPKSQSPKSQSQDRKDLG